MARRLTRSRFASGLVLTAPAAVLLFAACGGFDTIPSDDAGAPDSSVAETSTDDVTVDDTTVAEEPQPDARDGALLADVAPPRDAAEAGDAARLPDADAAALPDVDAARQPDADAAGLPDVGLDVDAARLDASDASDARDAALTHDPRLGTAGLFAVFSGMTVTNANATTITGDLGTYPDPTPIGTTMPLLVNGSFELGNGVAQVAATDLGLAYTGLTPANMPGCMMLTGLDLGTVGPLAAGIYCFSSSAQLTGTLVLDAQGNPNAEWFFQIGSTLTTASSAVVSVIGGGNQCNVYWQVASSATLGTGTVFAGNILALASVTLNTNTTVVGRALALNGSVTMDTNTVTIATCP